MTKAPVEAGRVSTSITLLACAFLMWGLMAAIAWGVSVALGWKGPADLFASAGG